MRNWTVQDEIHDAVRNYSRSNWYCELADKIEALIDNYAICKHASIVTGAYPRSNPPMKCDNCGVLYYE